VEWALALTRARTRGLALDVGCGVGRFLARGVIGVDIDVARLRSARQRSAWVVAGDAKRLPFPAASFDTVYAHRVLNDTGDVDAGLAEIARVLRPHGRLLIFTRARKGEGDRLDRSNGERRLRTRFHTVEAILHPADDRAAFFVAVRPR